MKNEKITLYYFGSANSTVYQARQTTITQVKKWKSEGHKNLNGIAFVLAGSHKNLEGTEINSYCKDNNLIKQSLFSIL